MAQGGAGSRQSSRTRRGAGEHGTARAPSSPPPGSSHGPVTAGLTAAGKAAAGGGLPRRLGTPCLAQTRSGAPKELPLPQGSGGDPRAGLLVRRGCGSIYSSLDVETRSRIGSTRAADQPGGVFAPGDAAVTAGLSKKAGARPCGWAGLGWAGPGARAACSCGGSSPSPRGLPLLPSAAMGPGCGGGGWQQSRGAEKSPFVHCLLPMLPEAPDSEQRFFPFASNKTQHSCPVGTRASSQPLSYRSPHRSGCHHRPRVPPGCVCGSPGPPHLRAGLHSEMGSFPQ